MADLVDLAMRRFKHCGDLGDLRCLREPGELIGNHGQVGAWSLIDVVAINVEKLIIEVALEQPSLRVKLLLGHHKGNLVCLALCMVDVSVFTSGVFILDFTVSRGLSTLTLKIAPPWNGGRGSCLVKVSVRVYVEAWDSELGFSSRMVWRYASERRPTWSMLTAGGGWLAIWSA